MIDQKMLEQVMLSYFMCTGPYDECCFKPFVRLSRSPSYYENTMLKYSSDLNLKWKPFIVVAGWKDYGRNEKLIYSCDDFNAGGRSPEYDFWNPIFFPATFFDIQTQYSTPKTDNSITFANQQNY